MPGTPNNQKEIDVSPNNHFLCKGFQLPYWNNHVFLVVWGSRWMVWDSSYVDLAELGNHYIPPPIAAKERPHPFSSARSNYGVNFGDATETGHF